MKYYVKVYPPLGFLYKFLVTKDIEMVDEDPMILHYTGESLKELKSLLKRDKPNLLINHSFSSFNIKGYPQAYLYLKDERDLLRIGKTYTNAPKLCRLYFSQIGLQTEIISYPSMTKKRAATRKLTSHCVDRLLKIWKGFKSWLDWS